MSEESNIIQKIKKKLMPNRATFSSSEKGGDVRYYPEFNEDGTPNTNPDDARGFTPAEGVDYAVGSNQRLDAGVWDEEGNFITPQYRYFDFGDGSKNYTGFKGDKGDSDAHQIVTDKKGKPIEVDKDYKTKGREGVIKKDGKYYLTDASYGFVDDKTNKFMSRYDTPEGFPEVGTRGSLGYSAVKPGFPRRSEYGFPDTGMGWTDGEWEKHRSDNQPYRGESPTEWEVKTGKHVKSGYYSGDTMDLEVDTNRGSMTSREDRKTSGTETYDDPRWASRSVDEGGSGKGYYEGMKKYKHLDYDDDGEISKEEFLSQYDEGDRSGRTVERTLLPSSDRQVYSRLNPETGDKEWFTQWSIGKFGGKERQISEKRAKKVKAKMIKRQDRVYGNE